VITPIKAAKDMLVKERVGISCLFILIQLSFINPSFARAINSLGIAIIIAFIVVIVAIIAPVPIKIIAQLGRNVAAASGTEAEETLNFSQEITPVLT